MSKLPWLQRCVELLAVLVTILFVGLQVVLRIKYGHVGNVPWLFILVPGACMCGLWLIVARMRGPSGGRNGG